MPLEDTEMTLTEGLQPSRADTSFDQSQMQGCSTPDRSEPTKRKFEVEEGPSKRRRISEGEGSCSGSLPSPSSSDPGEMAVSQITDSILQFVKNWSKEFHEGPLMHEIKAAYRDQGSCSRFEQQLRATQQELVLVKDQLAAVTLEVNDRNVSEEDFLAAMELLRAESALQDAASQVVACQLGPLQEQATRLLAEKEKLSRMLDAARCEKDQELSRLRQQHDSRIQEVASKMSVLKEMTFRLSSDLRSSKEALSIAQARNAKDAKTIEDLQASLQVLEQRQLQSMEPSSSLPQSFPQLDELFIDLEVSMNRASAGSSPSSAVIEPS